MGMSSAMTSLKTNGKERHTWKVEWGVGGWTAGVYGGELPWMVACQQRLEWDRGASLMEYLAKSFPSRRNSKCKGMSLMCRETLVRSV